MIQVVIPSLFFPSLNDIETTIALNDDRVQNLIH